MKDNIGRLWKSFVLHNLDEEQIERAPSQVFSFILLIKNIFDEVQANYVLHNFRNIFLSIFMKLSLTVHFRHWTKE